MQFFKSFSYWTCSNDEHISITSVESRGDSFEQLLENAVVYFEDWNGNVAREGWTIGDLSAKDYWLMVEEIQNFSNGSMR